jgi:hypothetical protein
MEIIFHPLFFRYSRIRACLNFAFASEKCQFLVLVGPPRQSYTLQNSSAILQCIAANRFKKWRFAARRVKFKQALSVFVSGNSPAE